MRFCWTLEELNKVKSSFNFTLLNMLHSRVAYPAYIPLARFRIGRLRPEAAGPTMRVIALANQHPDLTVLPARRFET